MKTLEEQLNNLHTLRLPEEARSRMRAELSSFADLHAFSGTASAIRSPLAGDRLLRSFHMRLYAGLAAVLVLVLGLGGTAYASASALPGDVLYPIKVNVAEPVQTALIPSASGKATWHAILAERRLEEAAQLAARGKLAANIKDELAEHFTAEVAASLDDANDIQEQGKTVEALSVRSDLEARVAAHGRILDVLADHYAAATSTDASTTAASLRTLLAVVADHQQQLVAERLALEDAIAPQDAATSAAKPATTATLALTEEGDTSGRSTGRAARPATLRAHVEEESAEREEEMAAILSRHATLLAKFLPPAASSTATTTASTTPEESGSASIDAEDADATGTDEVIIKK